MSAVRSRILYLLSFLVGSLLLAVVLHCSSNPDEQSDGLSAISPLVGVRGNSTSMFEVDGGYGGGYGGSSGGGGTTCPQGTTGGAWDYYNRGRLGYACRVRMERVRYCISNKIFGCTESKTPDQFSAWENADVDRGKQKDTIIAQVSEPNKANVEYLVLISAGQHQPLTNGIPSVMTGQPDNYVSDFDKWDPDDNIGISTSSFAYKLMNRTTAAGTPMFPVEKTFFAVVFDTQFNHTFGAGEKDQILNAYTSWLLSKAYRHKLKMIVLGGSSRGGCLSLRLAQEIQKRGYSKIPFSITVLDPVCKEGTDSSREMGASNPHVSNPCTNGTDCSSWPTYGAGGNDESHRTNFKNQYTNVSAMHMFNVNDGDEVVSILSGVRPLVDDHNTSSKEWAHPLWNYRQRWIKGGHTELGREYSQASPHITDALTYVTAAHTRMYCAGANSYFNGTSCATCSSGYFWNGSSCSYCTGSGASWNSTSGYCACTGGRMWSGSACVCDTANGYAWNGSSCAYVGTGGGY